MIGSVSKVRPRVDRVGWVMRNQSDMGCVATQSMAQQLLLHVSHAPVTLVWFRPSMELIRIEEERVVEYP
jgi:hypothetical protein